MKSGMFLMLDRSIMDHWLWTKKPFSEGQAWIDLLLLANIEDKKTSYRGEIITCKRGDVNYSISWLAERWKWSRKRTRNFLNVLENDEMVSVSATTNRTTITIVNYDNFNGRVSTKVSTKEQRGYQRGNSEGTTTKECKNEKNEKNNNKVFFPNDELLDSAFKDFVEMRKRIKAPLTDRAITLSINNLNKLSGGDNELAIAIINQTVMNGWKGFYPLKGDTPKKGKVDWEKEMEEVLKYERARSAQTDTSNDGFISELPPGEPGGIGGGLGGYDE